jgi:FkbM family methyltransferase
MSKTTRYIFDFGANRGQNLEYYLSRAEKVVAVEANPILCSEIQSRFDTHIIAGNLAIENVAVTDSSDFSKKQVEFYIHKKQSVLSQFPKPTNLDNFSKIAINSMSASAIIRKHLPPNINPFFVKIDLEGYDHQILVELFQHGIFPEFISAESHTIETFAALAASSEYRSFALVPGKKVQFYQWISREGAKINFTPHSAGPFGPDIRSEWYNSETFFQILGYEKLGWKDIHASKVDMDCLKTLKPHYVLMSELKQLTYTFFRILVPISIRKRIHRLRYLVTVSLRSSS